MSLFKQFIHHQCLIFCCIAKITKRLYFPYTISLCLWFVNIYSVINEILPYLTIVIPPLVVALLLKCYLPQCGYPQHYRLLYCLSVFIKIGLTNYDIAIKVLGSLFHKVSLIGDIFHTFLPHLTSGNSYSFHFVIVFFCLLVYFVLLPLYYFFLLIINALIDSFIHLLVLNMTL